eukprot:scaffold772_cov339-Pavlova_lutheri.AAC.82
MRHSTRRRPRRSASGTSPIVHGALPLFSSNANTKCRVPPAGAIRSKFLATRDIRSIARAFAADRVLFTTEFLSLSKGESASAKLCADGLLLSSPDPFPPALRTCSRKDEHIPELYASSSTPTSLQHRCGRGSKRTCLNSKGVSVRFSSAASTKVTGPAEASAWDPFSQTSFTLVVMRRGYSTSNLKCWGRTRLAP